MQFLFNLFYKLLDLLFGVLGSVPVPSWVNDVVPSISRYIAIANYYFPLDTLLVVSLSVLSITLVMMVVSFFLQVT